MAGAIGTIIAAVEARMTALGFTATDEVFNFDAVPDSVINKAYRIETRLLDKQSMTGQTARVQEELTVYVAYRPAAQSLRTSWKTAMDDREAIEKDITNAASILALASGPFIFLDRETDNQKYVLDYLVSKLVFTVHYKLSLT
jgi:K+-sensing histidine kinase KdpD